MKRTRGEKIFSVFNTIFLTGLALICLLPLWNLLVVSLSAKNYVQANLVSLVPLGFNTSNYHYMLNESAFWEAFVVSGKRVLVGVMINLLFTISAAYPLSKRQDQFHARKFYTAYFLIPMVFSGGLIPTYLVVSEMNLIDTLWALVLPEALEMYYVLLMMNFFRGIPGDIEEAALVDGASWYTQLAKAGKLADITDLFDLYCGDILRKTLMGKDGKVFQQSYYHFNKMVEDMHKLISRVYQQEIEAKRSELKQLQSQINPHFLYNCFFTIYRLSKLEDMDNIL